METLPPTAVVATALSLLAPPATDDGAPPTPTTVDSAPTSPKLDISNKFGVPNCFNCLICLFLCSTSFLWRSNVRVFHLKNRPVLQSLRAYERKC